MAQHENENRLEPKPKGEEIYSIENHESFFMFPSR
jgi:hypothetical protein